MNKQLVQQTAFDDWVTPDWPRIERMVALVEQCNVQPGVALDIGYAPRGAGDWLADRGWRSVGFDLNPRTSTTVPIITGDFQESFPFADACFDLIAAGEVIEHTFDDRAFLAECRRVLRPEGLLVLTTPNLGFTLNRLLVLLGKPPMFVHAPYHYRFYTHDTLIEAVRSAGFDLLRITGSHILYSRRRHQSGFLFEHLADALPSLSAHLIVLARKKA